MNTWRSAWLALAATLAVAVPGATSDPPKTGDASTDVELKRALRYLEAGQPARAAELIRTLLPRRDTAELHHLLGDAEEAAGNLLAAAQEFQRAAHMDPTEENLFDWGNNLLRLRAYQPATDVLAEAVKRHPRSARLQVGLGIARYSRGQYEDAIGSFCAAADLDPRDPRPYLFLGEMYGVSATLSPEITRRLARFVEAQPRSALGHFYYAMSLWKGEPGAAPSRDVEAHLQKAASLDPRLAKARFQLGVLYFDQRRDREAVAALQEAVRLEPAMAQAHYRLAQAYRRTGREDLARRELEAFERLQPPEAAPATPPPGGPGDQRTERSTRSRRNPMNEELGQVRCLPLPSHARSQAASCAVDVGAVLRASNGTAPPIRPAARAATPQISPDREMPSA